MGVGLPCCLVLAGWQAGMQEGAVDWDEDWDEFIDDGKGQALKY